jgi:ribosomal protein S18 acetylase RimI-like enzyme
MDLVISQANIDDLESLVELSGRYHDFEQITSSEHDRRQTLKMLLSNDAVGAIFTSGDGHSIYGYIAVCFGFSIELGGRDAFIDELYVEPEHRSRGLGGLLLAHALRFLQDRGIIAVSLEVSHDNQVAIGFYAKHGFEKRNRYFLMSQRIKTFEAEPGCEKPMHKLVRPGQRLFSD